MLEKLQPLKSPISLPSAFGFTSKAMNIFWITMSFLGLRIIKVKEVMNVKLLNDNHLYWPDFDIDLHLDSIKNPKAFPLVYKTK